MPLLPVHVPITEVVTGGSPEPWTGNFCVPSRSDRTRHHVIVGALDHCRHNTSRISGGKGMLRGPFLFALQIPDRGVCLGRIDLARKEDSVVHCLTLPPDEKKKR